MLPKSSDERFAALSADLVRFLRSELGSFNLLGRRLEGESIIWELTSGEGERLFLKQPLAHAFDRELLAYCDWLPNFVNVTPKLVGYRCNPWRRVLFWVKKLGLPKGLARWVSPKSKDSNVLLLSAAPGQRADQIALSAPQQRALHFQAGRFLRTLHSLPREGNVTPCLDAMLRHRAKRWAQRAESFVAAEAIAWVRQKVSATHFQALDCVPCHWDYQPRNWFVDLSDDRVAFSVIDFGDARYGVWLADLRKLYGGPWANRPDLERAFLQGYGRALASRERDQLRALAALDKLEAIVWSVEHQHACLEADNRQALEWLMSEEV